MSFPDGGVNMRKRSGIIFIKISCLIIAVIFGSFALSYGDIMLDKVVAVVNTEIITWSELYKAMEFEASPAVKALAEKERRKIYKDNEGVFLENLINMKLMLQASKVANIGASEAEITQTIKDITAKYGMNEDAFKAAIAKEGFTLDEYKKKLAEQIITGKIVDYEVRSKIVVTEKEITDYIQKNKDRAADEGYRISMIILKNSDDPAADEERVKAAYGKIKAGTAFADVAKQYSDDTSARAGGERGFVKKADLSQEFIDVLSRLKDGEVSEPFKTAGGTHIIKLEEARIYKTEASLKDAVKNKLFSEKFERAYKSWMKGLRQGAYVEIR
jgi:peptidyl-prolyl cis-trans isomerase SurA